MGLTSSYQSSKNDPGNDHSIHWDGNLLKITSPAVLPRCCIRCATEEHLEQMKETLIYLNPMVWLWIILGPVPLIIAYLLCRKKVEVAFSYCNSCATRGKKWAVGHKSAWVLFLFSVAILFVVTEPFILPTLIVILASILLDVLATHMKSVPLSVKEYQPPFFYIRVLSPAVKERLVKS